MISQNSQNIHLATSLVKLRTLSDTLSSSISHIRYVLVSYIEVHFNSCFKDIIKHIENNIQVSLSQTIKSLTTYSGLRAGYTLFLAPLDL